MLGSDSPGGALKGHRFAQSMDFNNMKDDQAKTVIIDDAVNQLNKQESSKPD